MSLDNQDVFDGDTVAECAPSLRRESSARPRVKPTRTSSSRSLTFCPDYADSYFVSNVEKHLQFIWDNESIEQATEVVSYNKGYKRYLMVVTHGCCDDGTEQHSLVGLHYFVESETVSVSIVLPIIMDTKINLRGDGELEVSSGNQHATSSYWFKPRTVHGFWQSVGKLFRLVEMAPESDREKPWLERYLSLLTQDVSLLNEWTGVLDSTPAGRNKEPVCDEQDPLVHQVKPVLTKIMNKYELSHLETVSSKELREACEQELGQSLRHLREYIDGLILGYMGRGEKASKIFDFLYLGSEWNASDLDFMTNCNVKQVLNCAGELENYFSGTLNYLNLRVLDVPSTDLMRYFDDTYLFLKEAKSSGHAAFVHCKMGVSRSASVVIAFAMKEYQWSFQDALHYVRQRRPIVQPNKGFMVQLQEYEGILAARNNKVWGSKIPATIPRATPSAMRGQPY